MLILPYFGNKNKYFRGCFSFLFHFFAFFRKKHFHSTIHIPAVIVRAAEFMIILLSQGFATWPFNACLKPFTRHGFSAVPPSLKRGLS